MPTFKPLPAVEMLREAFHYNPDTGLFVWKDRPAHHFSSPRYAKLFNDMFSGKQCFTTRSPKGYLSGSLGKEHLLAHRVAWKMTTGQEPKVIDHLDGDPSNNLFNNLCSGSQSQNMRNAAPTRLNTSGVTGVTWHKSYGLWAANIQVERRMIYLGRYREFADAVAARRRAEVQHGFSGRSQGDTTSRLVADMRAEFAAEDERQGRVA